MGASVSRPCHGRWVPTVPCRVLCHPTGGHQLQTRSKTHAPAVCVWATCAYKLWSWKPPEQEPPCCPRGSLLSPTSSPAQVGSTHQYPFSAAFFLYLNVLKTILIVIIQAALLSNRSINYWTWLMLDWIMLIMKEWLQGVDVTIQYGLH